MTSKDFKYLVPEKAHPSGCCTCRRWTIVLGVVATCMLGAIVVTLAIVNLEYFKSDLQRIAEMRGELDSVEEFSVMSSVDCGQPQLPEMYDVNFEQAGLSVAEAKCSKTRIKLEVVPCGSDEQGFLAVHNVNMKNEFAYYLVNDGGNFKESVQQNQNKKPDSFPEDTYEIYYNEDN